MPELQTLGKYQIFEELGRGSFATVYRARDIRLNREVALKILNPVLGTDPRFKELFLKEAQVAANLKHPNIVTIYEVDEIEGRLIIAMELLAGSDLRRKIERDGPLPLSTVVNIIEQVASALDYAHKRNLVHRDVKSANIIVDDQGNATLTDFGLVRALEGSMSGGSSLFGRYAGTPEYMSPEQVEGQPATAQSDLYSLGIITYEMVTGQVPFKADTPLAVIRMQADKLPRDLRELRPDLSEEVDTVVLRALAKRPEDRPTDTKVFSSALRECINREQASKQEVRRKQAEAEVVARKAKEETTRKRREEQEHETATIATETREKQFAEEKQLRQDNEQPRPDAERKGEVRIDNKSVVIEPQAAPARPSWVVLAGCILLLGAAVVVIASMQKPAALAPTIEPTAASASTLAPFATGTPAIAPTPTRTSATPEVPIIAPALTTIPTSINTILSDTSNPMPTPSECPKTHIVQAGESLFNIARLHNVNPYAIAAANNIPAPYLTYPGQKIIIPIPCDGTLTPSVNSTASSDGKCSTQYVYQPGDNLFRVSLKLGVSMQAIAEANGIMNYNLIYPGQVLCIPKKP